MKLISLYSKGQWYTINPEPEVTIEHTAGGVITIRLPKVKQTDLKPFEPANEEETKSKVKGAGKIAAQKRSRKIGAKK